MELKLISGITTTGIAQWLKNIINQTGINVIYDAVKRIICIKDMLDERS